MSRHGEQGPPATGRCSGSGQFTRKADDSMGIIAWIVLGALSGWIASMITGKNRQMGAFANIVVGIIGAFLGGFVMNMIGGKGVTGFNVWSLVVSIVGSVVLLWIVSLFQHGDQPSDQHSKS